MNPEEAKEYAKTNLEAYLNSKGINTSTNFSCLNPAHEDKHPSMSFDQRRNRCHCFSCGVDYDIFDDFSTHFHCFLPNQLDFFLLAHSNLTRKP